MLNLDNLPTPLANIRQAYIDANLNEPQKYNIDNDPMYDFYMAYIAPIDDNIDNLNQACNELTAKYQLQNIDINIYWEVLNHIEELTANDDMFNEFLIYLAFLKILNNDPFQIAFKKLIDTFFSDNLFDNDRLESMLVYALDNIYYNQEQIIISIVHQYKNHENISLLLFCTLDNSQLLEPQIKARIFDIIIENSEFNHNFDLEEFLLYFYDNAVLDKWFHLLSNQSQLAIRSYLNENPEFRDISALIVFAKKEDYRQYILNNELDLIIDEMQPNKIEPHVCDNACVHSYYEPPQPYVRNIPKIGRNDLCPCGSGKKYKKCCLV